MPKAPSPPPLPLLLHAQPPTPTTGSRLGPSAGPLTTKFGVPYPSTNERTPDGRAPGGIRLRPPPAPPNSTRSWVTCFKCQGWGHFASQCPCPRQAARPARALLVEIHNDDHTLPPDVEDSVVEVYEADPELATTFEGTPGFVWCIVKEMKLLTTDEHTLALVAPLGTTLSEVLTGNDTMPSSEDPLCSSIFSTFTRIGTTVIKILIDSGSVVIAVTTTSVHTLSLQTLPHPCPYKAMWINDASMAVTK